ncbi:hypothetical protein ACFVXC_40880 [Streptomyces sp. NPDC058257]|uniref:hypothetical protein n=1 Tax=Streptomyces sp. NPDC058257 TaxID=3346409 RepID=UPI0036E1CEAC
MIEVIAPIAGTEPQRCFQSSSARAMGSKGRLSGFGTTKTLPAGHMLVSPVSKFGRLFLRAGGSTGSRRGDADRRAVGVSRRYGHQVLYERTPLGIAPASGGGGESGGKGGEDGGEGRGDGGGGI